MCIRDRGKVFFQFFFFSSTQRCQFCELSLTTNIITNARATMSILYSDTWAKFDSLERDLNDKRKFCEEFTMIIHERAELEEAYAKNLEKISANLNALIERSNLGQSLAAFRSFNLVKSEQSKVLSESIQNDVIHMLETFKERFGVQTRQLMTKGRKIEKEIRKEVDKIESSKNKLLKEVDDMTTQNEAIQNNKDLSLIHI
eukprot:TRINITY_DN1200_c0_g3_i2.p1 TRINITY_DN1200_c0_g3~~TRINITY_DN1200_c0_g3_i2.p1  ORF type:complete len:226 (-),score=56.62 TRINITY_DN1200_c0_g3_i2:61-663(-)